MTATDELRRLLDERGVEHYDGTERTLWGYEQTGEGTGVYRFAASEINGGFLQFDMFRISPEQAIDATLGNDGVGRTNDGVAEREHIRLKAENTRLRKLCRSLVEYTSQDRCEGCACKSRCNDGQIDECWMLAEIREIASELGMEVDG